MFHFRILAKNLRKSIIVSSIRKTFLANKVSARLSTMPHSLKAHLFICTNFRENGECCAKKGSQKLRDDLKALIKSKNKIKNATDGHETKAKVPAHALVRINNSGCLGHCEEGITAVLYPQGKWLTHLSENSLQDLEKLITQTLDSL